MAYTFEEINPGQARLDGRTYKEVKRKHVQPAGLDEMLQQLDALMQSEEYDDDFQSPTPSAIARTRTFLEGASGSLGMDFPLGTLYADGVGGVRVEWIRPERELRLVVSRLPEGRSYLYQEQGADYAADYAPNVLKLGERLQWLDNLA